MKKILMLLIIVLAFIACDDKGKDDKCTCDPKEHYLPCTCNGTDCTCAVIPRGFITDKAGNQIPIYQTVGVSDADAITASTNIATAYNDPATKQHENIISGKITKILILAEDECSFDKNTGILEIGIDWCTNVDDLTDIFAYVVVPALSE